MKAKLQTNDYGNNLITETEYSTNQHYSHHNKEVKIVRVLSDKEAIEEGKGLFDKLPLKEKADIFKNLLRKTEGYTTSNCSNDKKKHPEKPLTYGQLVQYKIK